MKNFLVILLSQAKNSERRVKITSCQQQSPKKPKKLLNMKGGWKEGIWISTERQVVCKRKSEKQ